METPKRIDIRSLTLAELQTQLMAFGEPGFRAKQVYQWLWEKTCTNFDEMSNLSKSLRETLKTQFEICAVKIHQSQISEDRTIKNSFKLYDGNLVEGVLIPTTERMTACVSSQVGCSLTCKFCATGYMDRKRNLNADEIFDQVVLIAKQAEQNYKLALSNIVYMGMGEPLLNYANVLRSIERITAEDGLNMSYKRITVSTAGIAKMIKKLGDDGVKFNLALSLHAANNAKRSAIMPINDSNPLEDLSEALNYFYQKTKRKITLEYAVMNDTNDGSQEAKELIRFAKKIPCKVNLIEYNPIDKARFEKPDAVKVDQFMDYLSKNRVNARLRRSRGKDIDAACGQLANKG